MTDLAAELRRRLADYDDTVRTPGQAEDIAEADLASDVSEMVARHQRAWALPRTAADIGDDRPPIDADRMAKIEQRMKQEIYRDVMAGTQPADVRDFSTLHDHVDANTYAGLCDENSDVNTEDVAAIQERVHQWLVAGGAILPTMTVVQLRRALEAFDDDTFVVGYLDATEYLNVKGIDSTQHDEEVRTMPDSQPAAIVLNLTDNYDSRQW